MLPFARLYKKNTIENLWIYILTLIKKRTIYAYHLHREIKEKFGFKPGKITPYRVLYQLEQDGFVKSKTKDRKRIYQITNKGIKELQKAKNFYKKINRILNK